MEEKKNITCIVVGEGNLPHKCITILKEHGIEIKALVSGDQWLLNEHAAESYPHFVDLSNISVFEPVDFIFSINNSLILKKQFTSLARVMTINYHDAPLPRYAGMYASNWAILNGETEHGISWHKVVDEIDAGDIVDSELIPVLPDDTAFSINTRCFEAALKCFVRLVKSIVDGQFTSKPQDLSKRTYFPLAARPENFGLISCDMKASSIDRLIRATNFGSRYANEFILPLLFINDQYFVVTKASVVFDETGEAGRITEYNNKRGFYCSDGLVLIEELFDENNLKINPEIELELGKKLQEPNKDLAHKASLIFADFARFEPFWRKELARSEYIAWPVTGGDSNQSVVKTVVDNRVLKEFSALFPGFSEENILAAAMAQFLLRLSNQSFGTIGFRSNKVAEKIRTCEGFYNTWVPLNIGMETSDTVKSEFQKILTIITKAEKAGTFSRSTRIRYPELKSNALTQPEIIISTELTENATLPKDSITIKVNKNEISFSLPEGKAYSGVQTICESFGMFLQNSILSIDNQLNKLALLSVEKSLEIVSKINRPVANSAEITDISDQFKSVAAIYPEKTAIFDAGTSFSYQFFLNDVASLSSEMIGRGIIPGQIVAIPIGRNYNYFVAIMATLNCGASFLPIDPTMPNDRKNFLFHDAQVSLIITDREMTDVNNIPILNISAKEYRDIEVQLPAITYDPNSIAYIIYTSGSTGVPKGVKISRKALANFISGAIGLYEVTSDDRILQFSSLAFDASIEEIFCSFCSGASIYLRTEEMLVPDELVGFSYQHQISVWDLPTAFWRQVIHSDAYLNHELPESLRLVIIGGEAVSTTDVAQWNKRDTNHRLFNTYGPTETTVVALAFEIKKGYTPDISVPIGRPLPGYQIYITDSNRHLVPEGIAGELLVAGDSLAQGYLNREAEQNKAFIWVETPDKGLLRCYCTGDLVIYGTDGLVYYQGRGDSQVKIRGFRIEPGEIEKQICALEGIENCVVAVADNKAGEKSLNAFYTQKSQSVDSQNIKEELRKKLPAYMIPDLILAVEKIPLTSNGKVDKKSLLQIASERISKPVTESTKPTNEAEEFMLSIWKKILSNETIGIDDDFFDLGGHSLKAVQLMAEIKKLKNIDIPLASLIRNPTIRTFASLLSIQDQSSYWNCLVPIRPKGSKTPLFLIHGAGLNVLLYQSLTHHLKEDRPIYAFQAKGLDGKQEISNSIEEMANDYLEEIKKVQPNGPYMLLGFSLGGFIAYEMARKLTENGDIVRFAGVIDSVSSMARHLSSRRQESLFKLRVAIIKPLYVTWLLLREPWSGKRRLLHNKYKSIRFSLMFKLIQLGILKEKERKIKIEDGKPVFLSDNVEMAMTQALVNYKLIPSSIVLDLFRASKPTFYIPSRKDYGWGRFASKGVVVHTLPDEHSRIFAPPNDKIFAKVLDQRLDELEALS